MSKTQEFPFEEGDQVLVRVREHGSSGTIVAKFEAECGDIDDDRPLAGAVARFDFDWGLMNRVTLRAHEAEFEVIDGE